MGFVCVVNEVMCWFICVFMQVRGYDFLVYVLVCFGGVGGQYVCVIVWVLGMDMVYIYRYSGLLLVLGLVLVDVVYEVQEFCFLFYVFEIFVQLDQRLSCLEEQCVDVLQVQGFFRFQISIESFLYLCYQGMDCVLMVFVYQYLVIVCLFCVGDFGVVFVEWYMREFGFVIFEWLVVVDDV